MALARPPRSRALVRAFEAISFAASSMRLSGGTGGLAPTFGGVGGVGISACVPGVVTELEVDDGVLSQRIKIPAPISSTAIAANNTIVRRERNGSDFGGTATEIVSASCGDTDVVFAVAACVPVVDKPLAAPKIGTGRVDATVVGGVNCVLGG